MAKTYLLTFVKNGVSTPIIAAAMVQEIQRQKAKLKNDPKYFGGKLQVRTLECFKAKKII